jgi:acyl carrier protein
MSSFEERIAKLSPEKRELLLQKLKERGETPKVALPLVPLPSVTPYPVDRYRPFPLTEVQQTYWIGRSDFIPLGSAGNNIYMEFELNRVSPLLSFILRHSFKNAINRLILHHESFRLVILPDGQQQVLKRVPVYTPGFVDLRALSEQEVAKTIEAVRLRMQIEKAPLDRWPLFEFLSHYVIGEKLLLHMRIDALLMDGESRNVFLTELFQLLLNPWMRIPPIELGLRDVACAWTAFQASAAYQEARSEWLKHAPPLLSGPEFPLIRPIDNAIPVRIRQIAMKLLEPDDWSRLKAQASKKGVSASAILLAAFVEVLAAWSRRPSFAIGVIGTYRPPIHHEIERLIANFNTVYFLTFDVGSGTFEERARRLQAQLAFNLDRPYFSGFQTLRDFNRKTHMENAVSIPVFFNSVIDHSQLDLQFSSQEGTGQPVETSTNQSSSGWLRDAIDGIGAQMMRTLVNRLPQAREVETMLCNTQILLKITLGLSGGALYGVWQILDHILPEEMISGVTQSYRLFLQSLIREPNIWMHSWPETVRSFKMQDFPPSGRQYHQDLAAAEMKVSFVAPSNESESRLISIWEEVLGRQSIGMMDNFFALGGDSLKLVQMLTMVQKEFYCQASLNSFYLHPTLKALSDAIVQGTAHERRY